MNKIITLSVSVFVGIVFFLIAFFIDILDTPLRSKLFEAVVIAILTGAIPQLIGIHQSIIKNRIENSKHSKDLVRLVSERTRDIKSHISKLATEVSIDNIHIDKVYEWDEIVQETYVKTISDINLITKNNLRSIFQGQIQIPSDVFESIYIRLLRDNSNVQSYKSSAMVKEPDYFDINNIKNLERQYESIAFRKPVLIHFFIDDQRKDLRGVERKYYTLRKNLEFYNDNRKGGHEIKIMAGKVSWLVSSLRYDFGIATGVACARMRDVAFSENIEELRVKYELDFDPRCRLIWEKIFNDQANIIEEMQAKDPYYLNLPLPEAKNELLKLAKETQLMKTQTR